MGIVNVLRGLVRNTPLRSYILRRRGLLKVRDWTPHDEEMKGFYSQFLSTGDICFDVGANIGNRSKVFATLCKRVIAIEPQARCVQVLRKLFESQANVEIVKTAVGSAVGKAEMQLSNVGAISSLSASWVEAVKKSGRFGEGAKWDETEIVPITTMDLLIGQFGEPAFVKVDVEGFELEVFSGLSRAVKAASFEFTPERLDQVDLILAKFKQLGDYEVNFGLNEDMRLKLDRWISIEQARPMLESFLSEPGVFGDVYLRRK